MTENIHQYLWMNILLGFCYWVVAGSYLAMFLAQ